MSRQNKRNFQNSKQNQNNQSMNQSMNHADNNYPVDSINDVYESYGQDSVKRSKNTQKRSAQNKNESNCR